jgi:hypothetical protein
VFRCAARVAILSDRQRATGEAMWAGVLVGIGILTAMVAIVFVGSITHP